MDCPLVESVGDENSYNFHLYGLLFEFDTEQGMNVWWMDGWTDVWVGG